MSFNQFVIVKLSTLIDFVWLGQTCKVLHDVVKIIDFAVTLEVILVVCGGIVSAISVMIIVQNCPWDLQNSFCIKTDIFRNKMVKLFQFCAIF